MIKEIYDNYFPKDQHRLAIKISGGVDSGFAAFYTAKYIVDNKLPHSIQPIIIRESTAPFQPDFATHVLHIVSNLTGFNFLDEIIYDFDGENKLEFMRRIEREQFNSGIDVIISGITLSPDDNDFNSKEDGPIDPRTTVHSNFLKEPLGNYFCPLISVTKKQVANLYEEYGLMDTLFPYTRSCTEETMDFSKHCGKCWWCEERKWAFGIL